MKGSTELWLTAGTGTGDVEFSESVTSVWLKYNQLIVGQYKIIFFKFNIREQNVQGNTLPYAAPDGRVIYLCSLTQ
jgi:hypothetical protein